MNKLFIVFDPGLKNEELQELFDIVKKLPDLFKKKQLEIDTTVIEGKDKSSHEIQKEIIDFESKAPYGTLIQVLYIGYDPKRIGYHSIDANELYGKIEIVYNCLISFRDGISYPKKRIMENLFVTGVAEMLS